MDDQGLAQRIEHFRADYAVANGEPFQDFYCPILLRDEPAELIRGHIVNGALKTTNAWVPQRKDVDAFYGSVVEADLIAIIQDRGRNPFDVWLDPNRCRKHRPKLICAGETWGHYFTGGSPTPVPGHTPILVTDEADRPVANLSIKVAPERLLNAKDGEIELIIERDYRPAVIAAMLKAAHLTLFSIFGYEHVFSSKGRLLADILRVFFERHKGSHGVSEAEVQRYFLPFESMVAPLVVTNDNWFRGTVEDRMFLTCLTGRDEIFALGVIVRAGTDRFCVFLPTDCGKTVNTYFSFLNEPPPSIRAKATRFRPPSDGDSGAWEADINDLRLPLRRPMPDTEVPRAVLVQGTD